MGSWRGAEPLTGVDRLEEGSVADPTFVLDSENDGEFSVAWYKFFL